MPATPKGGVVASRVQSIVSAERLISDERMDELDAEGEAREEATPVGSLDPVAASGSAEFSWDERGRWFWTSNKLKSLPFVRFDDCLADWIAST